LEIVPRSITLGQRASIIRLALRGAPSIVLQDLLRGVHDRVVVAVTFLAMLELMKRREVVVEQAEPFGPITARRTTADERAAAGGGPDRARDGARGRCADRALRRRGCGAALAGGPRDACHRRLPPAGDPRGGRADPRRRLGPHAAQPPASPARGGARPIERA